MERIRILDSVVSGFVPGLSGLAGTRTRSHILVRSASVVNSGFVPGLSVLVGTWTRSHILVRSASVVASGFVPSLSGLAGTRTRCHIPVRSTSHILVLGRSAFPSSPDCLSASVLLSEELIASGSNATIQKGDLNGTGFDWS